MQKLSGMVLQALGTASLTRYCKERPSRPRFTVGEPDPIFAQMLDHHILNKQMNEPMNEQKQLPQFPFPQCGAVCANSPLCPLPTQDCLFHTETHS